jgi:hypothetical protein
MAATNGGRKYDPGKRRITMYMSWSYPAEIRADLGNCDNRYSALAEARRIFYPAMEQFSDPKKFDQRIPGTMDMFAIDFKPAQQVMQEASQQPVPILERVNKAGDFLPLDERTIEDVDTLIILGGDHLCTSQRPNVVEADALRHFLSREGTRLVICPHHDVGASEDWATREMEHRHHGDAIVSGQDRWGGFARALFEILDIPVVNRYGLSPAKVKGTNEPVPLSIVADLDTPGLLQGVTTFNVHMHLPHLALTRDDKLVRLLATQAINPEAPPHPFVDAGNQEFNALLWFPPNGKRAGDVLVTDVTHFMTMFGGAESQKRFWQNLAHWGEQARTVSAA